MLGLEIAIFKCIIKLQKRTVANNYCSTCLKTVVMKQSSVYKIVSLTHLDHYLLLAGEETEPRWKTSIRK
jgi:hypothetical protein